MYLSLHPISILLFSSSLSHVSKRLPLLFHLSSRRPCSKKTSFSLLSLISFFLFFCFFPFLSVVLERLAPYDKILVDAPCSSDWHLLKAAKKSPPSGAKQQRQQEELKHARRRESSPGKKNNEGSRTASGCTSSKNSLSTWSPGKQRKKRKERTKERAKETKEVGKKQKEKERS